MKNRILKNDALLVVDIQRDFCAGGALPVHEGDWVVPVINRWIKSAQAVDAPIFACRDWHPELHISFQERGGPWPAHCLQGTPGAEFHPALRLPEGTEVFSKGADPDKEAYSAFDGTELAERLREEGVQRVWIGGLTLDYCVKESTLDARREGLDVNVLLEATRPVNLQPDDGDKALAAIRESGAHIIEGDPR